METKNISTANREIKFEFASWTAPGRGLKASGKMYLILTSQGNNIYKVTGWSSSTSNSQGRICGMFSDEEKYFENKFAEVEGKELSLEIDFSNSSEFAKSEVLKVCLEKNKGIKDSMPPTVAEEAEKHFWHVAGVVFCVSQNCGYNVRALGNLNPGKTQESLIPEGARRKTYFIAGENRNKTILMYGALFQISKGKLINVKNLQTA